MVIIQTATFEIDAYGETFIIRFEHLGKNKFFVTVKVKGINSVFFEYDTEALKNISGAAATLVLEQALLKYPKFKKSQS